METLPTTASAQARQTRQQFVSPEDYLSYELGKAVRELPPLYTRMLAGTLSALIFGVIGWAYFSIVDEVAVTQGELVPSVQVRPVRALEGGVIREIHVKEGQQVKKGDVLLEEDPKLSQSEVDRLQKNAQLVQQDIARLEAESKGQTNAGTATQDQLLAARLQEFDTKQAAATADAQRQRSAIAQTRVQLDKLQENLINAQSTLANARNREASLRQLVDGAVPRLDYLQAQDQLTEAQDRASSLEQEILSQQETIQQAQQAYESAQQSADRLSAERQSEILTQLTQRRESLADIQGQLALAKVRAEGQVITAPIDGKVYNVEATLGSRTVQPGDELLSILPDGHDLLLEVKVLNRDIGFIEKGQPAKIKVATFPFQEFGTISGEVISLSPNATADRDLGLVFKAKVRLSRDTIRVNGKDAELTPGMAATAEIVTRKRSILTFLLEPVTKRFDEAFSTR
ncbi:MAG: HlyD family type I secretion periplasmic adaptor subunit [Drouetiella hepatica Uher 2000/2452]|jgi:HlyD family secretion protein|uniref:HlyD family type I secretion periplasmic adaptor subunit n=1 Tax=Drouetiella hepatica Uher 2000/2452 TaxID=904376 RepID=A0A951QEL1_9CYAN|nr:HlyD family type I secretion periplasmic adaptor subunit [Drouetiella hepatica Uher 2000/2452]